MKNKVPIFILFLLSVFISIRAQNPWQSSLLTIGQDGRLIYHKDENGFILPDFSHAGYKGGGVDIPDVAVVKEISAVPGDNTRNIQDAIDYVGSLPLNAEGFRGALLLKAGKYDVFGRLYVKYDGVILRGEGQGDDSTTSTIIYARGNTPNQRDVLLMGNPSRISGTTQAGGTQSQIIDDTVQIGSNSFNVDNLSLYSVGDRIIIYHPATQEWVDAVDKGGVPYPDPSAPSDPDERWGAGQLPILYNRFITEISGSLITVDAPVFYSLVKSISESYIYKPNMNGLINQVGIENLRVDIETLGGTDEAHAWQAVRFKSCENSWAKNCTFIHFGQSGIITEACSRSSFISCSAIDPVAIITGERMYNFNTYLYSQLNLFSNCYARNGRHHYVSNGTSTTSGNVFLRCTSDAVNSVNEGHRQWTQGMLYDNHKEVNLKRDFVLGLYNRVAMGTGHGWAAVHSVLWNCDVDKSYGKIGLQKPPTAQNYAIGCFAKTITGTPISASSFTRGYVEGQNLSGLQPASIYDAQLADRLSTVSVRPILQELNVNIYPVIVENDIRVNFKGVSNQKTIIIYNLTGSVIREISSNENSILIAVSDLYPGMYLMECRSDNAAITKKFIKK
ncbi:MAG: T9SS type A sorting domain-containing protein [Bacteroidales bacterium]|nr:T9SS type A sorting domain-containing protein [Bacteroidales bacterium]MCB8999302.1 T9SS type A sorting domain-containing protein [Bacteroidales bacterium]MCB9012442.1 T9SS type A sorting domain-containing protein [Bacteroidales bacterium]